MNNQPLIFSDNPCFDVDLVEDLSAVSHCEIGRNLSDLGGLLGG